MIQILRKLGIEGNFLNLIKGINKNMEKASLLMLKYFHL